VSPYTGDDFFDPASIGSVCRTQLSCRRAARGFSACPITTAGGRRWRHTRSLC